MEKIDLICCFTGHRKVDPRHAYAVKEKLLSTIEILARNHKVTFRAGGAMGFDTLAALCVLEKREEHPDSIKLSLCLPCRNQTRGWDNESIEIYNYIKENADEITVLNEEYTSTCMFERNRHMVDGSDVCIAYCADKTSTRGGTAYTVRYAESKKVRIIDIIGLI